MPHELVFAASKNDTAELTAIFNKRLLDPSTSDICREALLAAIHGGHQEAVAILLDRGVSPNAESGGFRALHAVAENGSGPIAKSLLEKKADPFFQRNSDGWSAKQVCLSQKPPTLRVMKELLRFGVRVEEADYVSGLAAIMREVKMETMLVELKKKSEVKVDLSQMDGYEEKIWRLQREHMALVEQREYYKAGKRLSDMEKELRDTEAEVREANLEEVAVAQKVRNERIELERLGAELRLTVKDWEEIRLEEQETKAQFDLMGGEVKDAKAELQCYIKEKSESDAAAQAEQAMIDASRARVPILKDEMLTAERTQALLHKEIQEATTELNEFVARMRKAAELTLEAGNILGSDPLTPSE